MRQADARESRALISSPPDRVTAASTAQACAQSGNRGSVSRRLIGTTLAMLMDDARGDATFAPPAEASGGMSCSRAHLGEVTHTTDWKERPMAELIVVGFKKDMYRASEALNMIQDMNSAWMVDLSDAVAVYAITEASSASTRAIR
ncbi:MAG: hypothetical protein MZV70_07760 [Desulfobacterales bacterium]|nr:hypothetical protein [Desulfobacterales bacterium]